MDESLEINGSVPELKSQVIQELLCTEMWCNGILEEPANVIYIKANNAWFRHYYDYGIVFWRKEETAPTDYEMEELKCTFKVVDLLAKFQLNNLTLLEIESRAVIGGSETEFKFSDGRTIVFSNIDDVTKYRT